jgi:isoleucyl-tRNA synthetase
MFREVPSSVDLPKLEHRILQFWKETNAFEKRVALNKGKRKWSFIDGPITANNPMGVHHAWGRTYKDLFERYYAMRGHELQYRNGFDCQGLWIEVEVEKELGFKSKREIEAYGVAEFVKRCKQRALRFAAIQVEQSIRLGYWMDWDDPDLLQKLADALDQPDTAISINGKRGPLMGRPEYLIGRLGMPEIGGSYFTLSDENNYTIWSALKKCHDRGWIYKGTDVLPWCPRCSTAISEHEIATEGYRQLTHDALTIKFSLRGKPKEFLLVWTTTPWTLSSNVAAAVHPDLVYVKIRRNDEIFYLAKATVERTIPDKHEVLSEMLGQELEGVAYLGPFDELESEKNSGAVDAHRVILWKEVSETEGTGIVHIAPGCGKEDLELGKEHGLPAVAPLDEFGTFTQGFGWLTGMHVYETADPVIKDLEKKGLLFKVEKYAHRYPVCWRCGSELVFRLVDEWFISMGKKIDKPLEDLTPEEKQQNLRYQIIDVAKQVHWIPGYGLQQELDWLSNMDDWMISKKRYWGLALPIWKCSQCGAFDVIGSEEELRERSVEGMKAFEGHSPHRPWIDHVKIQCPKCSAQMSRIQDVGTPWLDAGIVAYSSLGYRYNRKYWEEWFPADLVCESLPGQFRNWFYSMLAMSTVMERRCPFLTCFGHGTVLAEDGREMHKSWGTAIWFDDAVEKIGADPMRWIYCSTRPDADLFFGYGRGEEVKKRFLIPLWNVYIFFTTYARLDGWTPGKPETRLTAIDEWLLSKLQTLNSEVSTCLDSYDPAGAAAALEKFVDQLSTWYVRRSRRRFWKSTSDTDKEAGYQTLYTCLTNLVEILAPFIPFVTEEIYQNLVRSINPTALESVHHCKWPLVDKMLISEKLVKDMDLVIKVCSLGRAARGKCGVKLRQPLSTARIVTSIEAAESIRRLSELIKEELNVKELDITGDREELVEQIPELIPEVAGERHGKMLPKLRDSILTMDPKVFVSAQKEGVNVEVMVDGRMVSVSPDELRITTKPREEWAVVEEDDILVGVKKTISAELALEGLARDIVRRIQDQRKKANFNIEDRILVYYEGGPKNLEAFSTFDEYIAMETLAVEMKNEPAPKAAYIVDYKLAGERLTVGILRAKSSQN